VVVRAEDCLGGARRGDDDVGHLADVEEHEAVRAGMFPGEAGEGDVRVAADQVQVAYDGELWRGGRKTVAIGVVLLGFAR
jgi:hypothetical protein